MADPRRRGSGAAFEQSHTLLEPAPMSATSPASKTLLPSPFADEPRSPGDGDDNDGSSTHAVPRANAPRPPFMPFFTLIEDVSTSTHHHPNVHYVFSDDDTDLMTHAALRALSPSPPPPLDGQGQAHAHAPGTSSSSVSASLHDGLAQPQERYLVLDLNATGDAVTAAHSLSTDWQVIGVDVTSAPTWDGDGGGGVGGGAGRSAEGVGGRSTEGMGGAAGRPASGAGSNGLMLRIEGTGVPRTAVDDASGGEEMHDLLADFERRMEVLRKVMQR